MRGLNQRNLLDTYGLLLFLQKEGSYQVIKTLFRDAQTQKNPVLLNEMSVGEVFHITARTHSLEKAEAFLPLLEVLPMEIVSNDLDNILRAARINSKYSLGYMRALIAATAEKENAVLLTGDPEFQKLDGVVPIRWLD